MASRYTFEQKLTDFEQAVREQIFDAAEWLLQRNPPHNLAALRLIVSYFEPIAKYCDGYARSGSSKHYFVKGCRRVIARRNSAARKHEVTNQQLEGFYEVMRCGLAHGATLPFSVAISASNYALSASADGTKFSVNPRQLLALLRSDLDNYVGELRDPKEATLREHFQSRWDFEAAF